MKVIHSKALNGGYATEGDGPNEEEMKALKQSDTPSKIPSFSKPDPETKSNRAGFSTATSQVMALTKTNWGSNLREVIMKYAAK